MVFNKNKKEDEEDSLAEGVETAGTSVSTPEKKQSGFSRLLSCLPGSRVLTPLILATGIGTQVQTAMAQETHSQYATLASSMSTDHVERGKAPSAEEISTYFENHKSSIFKKLDASSDDKKTVREIKQAIELLANNNRTHTVIITSGELGHKALAQYAGLTHTIKIPKNFNVHDAAHQSNLIHEIVHALQDGLIVEKAQSDHSLGQRRDAFWNTSGTEIAVAEHEQAAIEVAIAYVNSMTDGALEKAVNDYGDFAEYKVQAKKALQKKGVKQSESIDSIIHRSYFYYGLKKEWPYFIQHLYGCNVGAVLYSDSFVKIGKPDAQACEDLKKDGGM